jgi:hypothetical protein
MAEDVRMALEGSLRKAEAGNEVDFLREDVRVMAQALTTYTLDGTSPSFRAAGSVPP